MALPKIDNSNSLFRTSLKQLNDITEKAYSDKIRAVALETWQKHLNPENPQWKFIKVRSFYISDNDGSAHVMAMIDQRMPRNGLVGYFACTNSKIGAKALLSACEWLGRRGLHDVYGPIKGTLPNDYRLNLSDDHVFPGEPVNPKWHIDAFERAGFSIFNRYASAKLGHFNLVLKLNLRGPKKKDYLHMSVRSFDNSKYEQDFKKYHDLRNLIFPFQSVYCPAISLEERVYNSSGKFDSNYTYFLIDNGKEVGFVMAYIYNKQLIFKTIGLLPDYRGKRLSRLLLEPVHKQATKEGIKTAIYGMVREGNNVHKSKHPLAKVFRRYVTMHKKI